MELPTVDRVPIPHQDLRHPLVTGECFLDLSGGPLNRGVRGHVDVQETRTRFQDIISANLNTRRAIGKLVLPYIAEVLEEVGKLREQQDRIEALLMSGYARSRADKPVGVA